MSSSDVQASCLPLAGRVEPAFPQHAGSPATAAGAGRGSAAALAPVPSIDDCYFETSSECWYATWDRFSGQGFSRTGAYQSLCTDVRRGVEWGQS